MLFEFYFEGKKPSKAQVKKCAIEAIRKGYPLIEISWGENMINLQNNLGQVSGHGWIKNIGGDDLARELNEYKGAF